MKKNLFGCIALPIGILLCMAFIFGQSLLSAEASAAESGRIVGFLVGLIGVEYTSENLVSAPPSLRQFVLMY